jgi:hypothetical protein
MKQIANRHFNWVTNFVDNANPRQSTELTPQNRANIIKDFFPAP